MELAIGLPGSQSPAGSESQSHLAAMPAPARTLAFEILQKVDGGGYASDLLAERSVGLDSRDAGLAAEIVFGVLRYRAQLDYLIEHYSGRARRSWIARCASPCAWASTSFATWSASRRTPRSRRASSW